MIAEDIRSFARKKFEMIEAAGSDSELPASLFRLLLCVLDRLPEGSDKTALGDDYLRDECPGYRRDGSLRKARSALQRLGYWRFKPGSGRTATVYTILWDRVSRLLAQRKARAQVRKERRDERDEAFRALAKIRRGDLVATPGKIDPPSSSPPPKSEAVPLESSSRGQIKYASPQTAQIRGGKNDPPFNSSTSIEEASEREVLSRVHAREIVSAWIPSVLACDILLEDLGQGDLATGFKIALDLGRERLLRLKAELDAGAPAQATLAAARAAAFSTSTVPAVRRPDR